MKPITNIALNINIDSGNAAFVESPEAAAAELKRILTEAVDKHIGEAVEEDNTYEFLHDVNGNRVGIFDLDVTVNEDIIDDEDDWRDTLRQYISENGFHMEDISTTFHDLDAAYEHDPISVEQWFANHTDARIEAEEVIPEASNWSFK